MHDSLALPLYAKLKYKLLVLLLLAQVPDIAYYCD